MGEDWDLKILCMGAGYVGGPTMAVIAKQCPKVRISTSVVEKQPSHHGIRSSLCVHWMVFFV